MAPRFLWRNVSIYDQKGRPITKPVRRKAMEWLHNLGALTVGLRDRLFCFPNHKANRIGVLEAWRNVHNNG